MLESTFSDEEAAGFSERTDRIDVRFFRKYLLGRAEQYLSGFLSRVERKRRRQFSEATETNSPHGFFCWLGRAAWSVGVLPDVLLRYGVEAYRDKCTGETPTKSILTQDLIKKVEKDSTTYAIGSTDGEPITINGGHKTLSVDKSRRSPPRF